MSLWYKALQQIKQKVSATSYDTWLKSTKLLPFDEDGSVLQIETPNEFARDWIESRYHPVISETINSITGKHYDLEFVLTIDEKNRYNHLAQPQRATSAVQRNSMEDKLNRILNKLDRIENDIQEIQLQMDHQVIASSTQDHITEIKSSANNIDKD